MTIKDLIHQTAMPTLYQKGNAFMWDDPHISKQLLHVHLNQETDLASRKESTIDLTVDWILAQCPTKSMSILDLGCGPGLYCRKFNEKGHSVTGIDVSSNSIDYARSQSQQQSKPIEYINANYLDICLPTNKYDLVVMIYCDFGVLSPGEQCSLLNKVYKALNSGGRFIFDVLNDTDLKSKITPLSWEVAENGFWSDKPYMVLSNSFLYRKQKVVLYQHNVATDDDDIKTYRFWTQYFSKDDILNLVSNTKFKVSNSATNVLPESDLWSGKHVSFYTLLK